MLLATSVALSLTCVLVAVLGWLQPAALEVCSRPGEARMVCPIDEATPTVEQRANAELVDDVVGRTVTPPTSCSCRSWD